MNKLSIFFILLPALLITCTPKGNSDKENNTAKTSQVLSFPNPGAETFFPLLHKSAWHYEQFMEGTLEPGNSQVDSVIEVTKTDSGILCNMVRTVSASKEEYYSFLIKADSIVTQLDNSSGNTQFCSLFPTPGAKIEELTYSSFLNSDSSQIRLQTSDYETATEEQQMEWQGKIFVKGIGLVSFGGNSLGMNLTEYHIGNEPIKKYES